MVQLPQVVEVETVSLTDISPIYIFYNEKAPNDVEVNRKNLFRLPIGYFMWISVMGWSRQGRLLKSCN